MEKELLQLYESLDDEKCKDLFARQLIICHRHMHIHMDDMWNLIGDSLRGLACSGYCPAPSKPATKELGESSEPVTDKPIEPGSGPIGPEKEKPPVKDDSSGTRQPTDSGKPTPDPSKPDNGSSSTNGNTGFNPRPDIFKRNF